MSPVDFRPGTSLLYFRDRFLSLHDSLIAGQKPEFVLDRLDRVRKLLQSAHDHSEVRDRVKDLSVPLEQEVTKEGLKGLIGNIVARLSENESPNPITENFRLRVQKLIQLAEEHPTFFYEEIDPFLRIVLPAMIRESEPIFERLKWMNLPSPPQISSFNILQIKEVLKEIEIRLQWDVYIDESPMSLRTIADVSGPFSSPLFRPDRLTRHQYPLAVNIRREIRTLSEIPPGSSELVGDKTARLADLHRLGFPVPSAVNLSCELMSLYESNPEARELVDQSLPGIMRWIEADTRKQLKLKPEERGPVYGDPDQPLPVMIRPGGPQVMEGGYRTVFTGINDDTVMGLAKRFRNPAGAFRMYLKSVMDYGYVVNGKAPELKPRDKLRVPSDEWKSEWKEKIRGLLASMKIKGAVRPRRLRVILNLMVQIESLKKEVGFPQDVHQQARDLTSGISRASSSPAMRECRKLHRIPENSVPAVTYQRMILTASNQNSGAFVACTHDEDTGEPGMTGFGKFAALGSDVNSGFSRSDTTVLLEELFYTLTEDQKRILKDAVQKLRELDNRPTKLEVPVEDGTVWFVQAARLETHPYAKLKIALDLRREGRINDEEMKSMLDDEVWQALRCRQFPRPNDRELILVSGKSRYPGAVRGKLVKDPRLAPQLPSEKEYIFVIEDIDDKDWNEVLKRARGLVLRGIPPLHLGQTAKKIRIPTITYMFAADRLEEVPDLTPVILDSTRDDGFLTDARLERKIGVIPDFIDRLLKGGMEQEEVSRIIQEAGRRDGEKIRNIWGVYLLCPPRLEFEQKFFLDNAPDGNGEDVVRFLEDYVPSLPDMFPLRGLALERGWATEEWYDPEKQHIYPLTEKGVQFVRTFFKTSQGFLADLMLRTSFEQHSFSTSLFRVLLPAQQVELVNRMVEVAAVKGVEPGWGAGVFLAARFMSTWAMTKKKEPAVSSLKPESLVFLIKELFQFDLLRRPGSRSWSEPLVRELFETFVSKRHGKTVSELQRYAELQYLDHTLHRYPGLAPSRWAPFFRSYPELKFSEIVNSSEIPEGIRIWLAEVCG